MNVWIKIDCTHGLLSKLSENARIMYKAVCQVWEEDVFITSIDGDRHLLWSKHYFLDAFDVRPPLFKKDVKLNAIRKILGRDFDIVDEINHIHLEYDKKGV